MSISLDVLHWKEIKFSPIKIDPRMLLAEGHVVRRKCFLKNQNHLQEEPVYRYIRYDREFVVFFVAGILSPLSNISEENFDSLLKEVFYANFNKKEELKAENEKLKSDHEELLPSQQS